MELNRIKYSAVPQIKRPMVCAACGAVFISITAFYSKYPVLVALVLILPAAALLIAAREKPKAAVIVIFVSAVFLGLFNTYYKIYRLNDLCDTEIDSRFVATADSVNYDDFSVLKVISDDDALPHRTRLSLVYFGSETINCGDRFSACVKLSSLDNSEYKKTNYSNCVYVNSYVTKISSFGSPDKFYQLMGQTRRYIISVIHSRLSGDVAELLVAMTSGDRSYLSDTLYSNIKTTGISHVIVVSGLHLAILLGSLFKFLNMFVKNKYMRFALSVFCVVFIMGICGFTMSILRAGIMYIIAAFAPVVRRENDSFNTLGTAVTFILIFMPFSVFSISFQLSVLATYSIIVISPFYTDLLIQRLHIKNIIARSVLNMLLNTLSATVMTLPVIIRCFGYVSVVSPITNLLITYAVSWGLSFVVIAVLVSLIPLLSGIRDLALLLSGLCSKYMIYIIKHLSKLPFAAIQLGESAFWVSIVFIAVLIVYMRVFLYYRRRKKIHLRSDNIMPVFFEDDIKKDIKSGDFAPVYIFFGEDSYLKKYYLDSIIKKICGEDTVFDYQCFTGDIDLQSVYDAINQLPMLAQKRCIVVDDFDFAHASKSDYDRFCELVSDIPESCMLLLKFDGIEFCEKRGNREKKIISSAEKIGGKAVKLDHRNRATLAKMLTSGAAKRGVTIPDTVSRYLIEISGDDINTLRFELDKLCDFAGDDTITKDTVDLVCTKSVDASVYDYVSEILKLNLSGALMLLDNMFFMRVEPMIILYTMSSNYIDIYRIYAAEKVGIGIQTAAKDFGYAKRSFVLDRAKRSLGKLDFKRIRASLNAILSADRQLKSFGLDPRTVLEELTVKLVDIIAAKGDAFDKA